MPSWLGILVSPCGKCRGSGWDRPVKLPDAAMARWKRHDVAVTQLPPAPASVFGWKPRGERERPTGAQWRTKAPDLHVFDTTIQNSSANCTAAFATPLG